MSGVMQQLGYPAPPDIFAPAYQRQLRSQGGPRGSGSGFIRTDNPPIAVIMRAK